MQKQRLTQKLGQKMTPQQLQLIKLLQVSTAQLDQRIKEEIENNPALEEGKEASETDDYEEASSDDITDFMADDDIADYQNYSGSSYSGEEKEFGFGLSVDKSFHDHVNDQIKVKSLSEEDEMLAEYLVGNIDDDGYLRRPLISIMDDLAFSRNIYTDEATLLRLLEVVQTCEPSGVGARDLQECLLIQIRNKEDGTRSVEDAEMILDNYFDAFSKKQYDKLMDRLNMSSDELKQAIDEILKLSPKPANAYDTTSKEVDYILPDFILVNTDGDLSIQLNKRYVPELRVNRSYKDIILGFENNAKPSEKDKETAQFIKQKIEQARGFIEAIEQRYATMQDTMEAILNHQYKFFQTGDENNIKPMILKNIADVTGYDISTISRVSNSKYIQTEFGTFSLKQFFSEGTTNEDGEEISTIQVKNALKDIIDQENKSKPVSDQKLVDLLKEKGYSIARRTVAKYREQLNIPVARLRKEL